jgi:hypothetical protein
LSGFTERASPLKKIVIRVSGAEEEEKEEERV